VLGFIRNSSRFSNTECIYRVASDGSNYITPYLTKRIISTSNLVLFRSILAKKSNKIGDLPNDDQATLDLMTELGVGCFLLKYTPEAGNETKFESLTMHKFQQSVSLMESKDNIYNFHIRYFTEGEREVMVFDENEKNEKK
jgi:hypothetical protein